MNITLLFTDVTSVAPVSVRVKCPELTEADTEKYCGTHLNLNIYNNFFFYCLNLSYFYTFNFLF